MSGTKGVGGPDAPAAPGAESKKAHEVRLGLVLYGGVSLAIYINGVTHEVFRAVRGRGIYRLIKALTDSDIVVDILSGASAGGINGILLAFSLCNQREFGGTAQLWREHGDIRKLLRDPSDPLVSFRSILDSEGYYEPKLRGAFRDLWNSPIGTMEPEDKSETPELDLFVTGTDFHGRESTRFDDLGHPIFVKDHRVVFWLKHREERKTPFHLHADEVGSVDEKAPQTVRNQALEDNVESLAKLARITSCFPAAFAPVLVDGSASSAGRRLALWGQLDRPAVFIDGGVLDNKPFTSTLRAIFYRTAERPVSRYLLYVEPDAETRAPEKPSGVTLPETPNPIRAVLDSVTKIPSYESIADDLRSIAEHNDRIERYNRLLACLRETDGAVAGPRHVPSGFYRRARIIGLSEAVLSAAFDLSPGDTRNHGHLNKIGRWLDELFTEPKQAEDTLDEFDVDFRIRRLMFIAYAFDEQPEKYRAYRDCWGVLNRLIQALEIVRHTMQSALADLGKDFAKEGRHLGDEDLEKFWLDVERALRSALRSLVLPSTHVSEAELKTLAKSSKPLPGDQRVAAPPESGRTQVLSALDGLARRILEGSELAELYDRFERYDEVVFPMELVSGLHEKDPIRTVRLSPLDARRGLCARGEGDKVTGARLGHFAAFFKRSWRSNDILWGRLDGVCQLIETLLERKRVEETLARADDQKLSEMRQIFDLDSLFPHAPEDIRRHIARWRDELFDPATRASALRQIPAANGGVSSEEHGDVLQDLILAAQIEILHSDYASVVEDAAFEQMDWNLYRTAGREPASAELELKPDGRFVASSGDFDGLTLTLAAGELARRALERMTSSSMPRGPGAPDAVPSLPQFFRSGHHVGSETLENDVPRLVLLELIARALLVTRNALLNSLGSRTDAVRGNAIYRAFLDWPLRMFAAFTAHLRRAPAGQQGLVLASAGYILLSLIVLWLFGGDVIYKGDSSLAGVMLFIATPLTLVAVIAALLKRGQGAGRLASTLTFLSVGVGLLAFVGGAATLGALLLTPPGMCESPAGWWERLCEIPGVRESKLLLPAMSMLLPLLGGVLLGLRLNEPPLRRRELELLMRRAAPRRAQKHEVWNDLTRCAERPALWYVAPVFSAFRWAEKHDALDRLEEAIQRKAKGR